MAICHASAWESSIESVADSTYITTSLKLLSIWYRNPVLPESHFDTPGRAGRNSQSSNPVEWVQPKMVGNKCWVDIATLASYIDVKPAFVGYEKR